MEVLLWIGKGVLWLAGGIVAVPLLVILYLRLADFVYHYIMPWVYRWGWMKPPDWPNFTYDYEKGTHVYIGPRY